MPTTFRPYAPDQDLLLPPSLHDWLPEDHMVYFINEVIEELDLSAFYAPYEGDGRRRQPYAPNMMLKVLVYAYVNGVFSFRKIARKLEEDVAFRVLAAGNFPRHRTICEFRKRHLKDFKALFVEVVQIAGEAGLTSLGTLAIDGTKVRANASKHKAMSYKRMQQEEQRLSDEIESMCTQAEQTDEIEDARYGTDDRGDEIPEELQHRESRLARIREAKKRLEEEQRAADEARGRQPDDNRRPPGGGRGSSYARDFGVPEDKAQSNFTDPESRIMKTGDGFQQCYNGQLAVDEDFQIIVANELTANNNDQGAMTGLLDQVEATTQSRPDKVLADAGYRKEEDFIELENRQIDAYISVRRERQDSADIDPESYPATCRMVEKLSTPDGQERYRDRKHIVEAVNGWIKQAMGFRRFSIRGLEGASGEWNLVCMATNLRRMKQLMTAE